MERSSWTLISLAVLGLGALVAAYAPSAWPNPIVRDGGVVEDLVVPTLRDAAVAVDAACRRGDRDGFVSLTTDRYRADLENRLEAAGLSSDLAPETLASMASEGAGYASWLERYALATHALYDLVSVAVERDLDRSFEPGGAQVLVFRWDGARFLLDEVHHATRVFDADDADRYLQELLRLR